MEAFHKLKVESPYEILEIEDIKISNNPNEHGRLYLKALLDDSINFKYAIEASTDDKISIYEETEDKEKSIIFNGTIQNIRTENINGIYYMEIEAYTSSFELDIKEKSRSFQDAEMSYDDLIKTILLDYKIYSFTQRMDKPMSIGRPLFQYKETDYEFLKRVASQIGLEINCDIINTNNVFYFGRPWGKEYKIEDNIDYEALKDIKKYRESLVHSPNFHDTDFFYYKIRTRKLMELGAQVVFKQKKFYINSYEAEYVRGELIYTYKLCRERGIWQEKLYNDKIKGISLEGEVLEVSGEKVKLHLDIDETQNKDKVAWFRYAPPTGNLMYSMPIVGTNANLYFSSERSEDPIVIGCIRKNGSSCESFSDVNNRYFSTESGNNLDMLPGAINFSRPGLSANFNDGSGINLSSSSSLNISAGYVGIYAGDITIKAKSKLEAKKGESSFISLENDFYNNAGIVMENGSDKASNGAFDDDPQKGAAEAKKAKAAMESAVKVALAAVVGAVQGAMGKIGECLAGVGNNASSTSNVDLRDSNNKSLMNTQTDVAGYKKDETYITKASKNVKPIDTDPYRVHVGESGDGFWGKVADIWVSTPVYKCLASMARWQDNHQQEMELLNIGMIFAGVTAATVSLPMAENECEIANKNAIKVTNKSSSILDEELEKIISGTKVGSNPKIKYDYNMIENPGPLAKIDGQPASNFYGGKYNTEVLTEDRIYYRAGQDGKPLGQWFTSEPAESVAKVRIDTAVKEQWIDQITGEITGTSIIDTNYAIKIPKGTTVYTGPVGYQGGVYLGGDDIIQTFIQEPWKLNVEVISKIPLK
ncbi:hypothetical protein [Clostridium butyricum]